MRPCQVGSLRSLSHGGSPIATEVVRRAHSAFPNAELIHVYGATELAPMATALRHEEKLVERPGALVRPGCGWCRYTFVDPSGHDLPPGEIGEVVVRGPNVMQGAGINPSRPPTPSETGGITAAISVA